ncbi:TRM11 family SAM-dependent methyltransferase [Brachybacterium sp. GCM10030267]|uniref:TRM11 family SAM-dependent methyltransferase n=1 Tax=Brachybacterium sp. GCM10030267 TaxID=3273381 RepID=UPI003614ED55
MQEVTLVLRAPSANRVYTEAAGPLAVAEARWVLGAHLGTVPTVRERRLGGMDALEIRLPSGSGTDPLRTQQLISALSVTLGAFDVVEDEGGDDDEDRDAQAPDGAPPAPLLRPRELPATVTHPGDLETILKYPGKTNEQFTALLINLAAALSTRRAGLFDGTLSLLDPLCGRGTTLNRALRLGLSPLGAEIDRKDVDAYRSFLTTWLRSHRYKHTLTASKLTLRGQHLGTRLDAELAAGKQAQREGRSQRVSVLGCDTTLLGELLPDRSVDALVADLPYGVQHGAKAAGAWQRSPLEVLRSAAGPWRSLLRDGGGLALAINRHTLAHEDASDVLAGAGLRVISRDGAFRHRVDRSIDRDVLLAIPTDHPRAEQLAALGADQEKIRP